MRRSGPRVSATYGSHALAHDAPNWAVRLLLGWLAVFLLLTPIASRQLTAIRVSEGDDLQAAIDAARPGETLLLAPGALFVGNYLLPAIADAQSFITIRTDGPGLPGSGVRTGPSYAGRLATIQSPNSEPAIRTAPAAHHWRLENLQFRANRDGFNDIIALGSGTQRTLAEVPYALVLDRLLVTGDPEAGQKRGITLNSGETEVRNCYVAGIRGVGMDTQAVGGWNGPGPYVIENNYLEAAGENIMFGGSDSAIPDLVTEGITIRRNLLRKPAAWRDAIVGTPSGVRANASRMGGTLASGAYAYSIVSERPSGQGTTAVSTPSTPVNVSLDGTTSGSVAIEWEAVTGAAAYRVYRSGPDGSTRYRTTTTHFTDTGAAGTAGTPPDRATVWSVKNLFELKNARNVLFEGNVLEHNWLAAQPGYAILLQPANQNGRAPWVTLESIRIVNNVIRDVSSAIHILGIDQRRDSGRARGITISNNLFVNVDKAAWGGAGDFLLIGGGAANVHIEHNTVLHTGRIIAAFGGTKEPKHMEGFVFRNNLLKHNEYGVKGDGVNSGEPTLARYFPGVAFEGNVLAGGSRTLYPLGNHFPSVTEFDAMFINPAAGNFRLRSSSPYRTAGVDGRPVGVDMDALERALAR
jgi:hypothetical protein